VGHQVNFPHALPECIISARGPPGVSIYTGNAGVRAKEIDLAVLRLYRCNECRNGTLVSNIKSVSLRANFSTYGRDRIGIEISDNDSLSALCDKARGECFANAAGATRYNTDFASDLHA
jgi:hypothetical protein